MSDGFDPYHKWLGIPPADQPPNHYRLLGISPFESDLDVIANAADQRMSHVRTFQSGRHSADSQKLLNEISAAKVCLLNAAKKEAYDAQLRASEAKPAPARKAAPPVLAAEPLAPEAVVEPAPFIESGPAAGVPSRSPNRWFSAGRQPSWQAWTAVGVVVGVLIVVGVFLLLSSGPGPVGQDGQSNPPVNGPIEPPKGNPPGSPKPKPPEVKPRPPKENPKPKPPEVKPKPPKQKPKPPPEPLFGPVPDAAALKDAQQQLGNLLSDTSPAKLIAEADAEGHSRAQRYALLTRAKDLAVGAGDVKTALAAVDQLQKRFEIDAAAVKTETRTALGETLERLAEKADTPKANQSVAESCLLLIDDAKAAGQKDLAKATAPVALAAARKSGDGNLVKRATLVFLEMRKDQTKE